MLYINKTGSFWVKNQQKLPHSGTIIQECHKSALSELGPAHLAALDIQAASFLFLFHWPYGWLLQYF